MLDELVESGAAPVVTEETTPVVTSFVVLPEVTAAGEPVVTPVVTAPLVTDPVVKTAC